MANPPRTRKRILAVLRAPDGSAFQKCDLCGVSVTIALYDMHECKLKKGNKRFKGEDGNQSLKNPSICDQPRSPFCVFMESFKKAHKTEDWIDVDRKGFETWKNMSTKERHHFAIQADSVNYAYEQALLGAVDNALEMDDEADSMMVGKFDLDFETYEDWENSESFESFHSKRFESFDSIEWNMVCSWID